MKRSKQLTSGLNPFLSIFLNCVLNIKQLHPFTLKVKPKIYFLLLSLLLASEIYGQILYINGNISADSIPVSYASITFVDESDSSNKFTALTDVAGNYQLDIITGVKEDPAAPTSFELAQNYPNPFSNETAISYKLKQQSDVQIVIYDVLGREVKTYSTQQQGGGIHGVILDGKNNLGMRVSSGVYFYKVKTGNETQVKKMILNRSTSISGPLQIQSYMLEKTSAWKEEITVGGGTYKVTIKSDTNTTPLIVIKVFPNQQIDSDTTLNYEVEKARIILYQSIDDVEEGDDSLTVINKLGEPNYISDADLDGYIFHYYNESIGLDLAITLYPTSAPKVVVIEADGIYSGKTKEGVNIGMYREETLKLLGMPLYTVPGSPPIEDFYKDPLGYLPSSFLFTYDENEKLIRIRMFP
ncbi:T9SS type A sorting domain-containing protein [bacterium BMS3Abin03]|nr:T9SS type A sorting domain-containing protein [bacterium BMS3Abin03]